MLGLIPSFTDFFSYVIQPWLYKQWWHYKTGKVITVPWPTGIIDATTSKAVFSSDPNEHYRPWLEENVGKQGLDWDWSLNAGDLETLIIRFVKGKEHLAVQASLMWN